MDFDDPNFKKETLAYGIFKLIEEIFDYCNNKFQTEHNLTLIKERETEFPITNNITAFLLEKRKWLPKCKIMHKKYKIECYLSEIEMPLGYIFEIPSRHAMIVLNNTKIFYAIKYYDGSIDKKNLWLKISQKSKIAFEAIEQAVMEIDEIKQTRLRLNFDEIKEEK